MVEAPRRASRATLSAFVTDYGWPTGCRLGRGSHGASHVYDTLGTERPPSGWPYERPGRVEVEEKVKALAAIGTFLQSIRPAL